jgi:hypothetical protein
MPYDYIDEKHHQDSVSTALELNMISPAQVNGINKNIDMVSEISDEELLAMALMFEKQQI